MPISVMVGINPLDNGNCRDGDEAEGCRYNESGVCILLLGDGTRCPLVEDEAHPGEQIRSAFCLQAEQDFEEELREARREGAWEAMGDDL